MTKLKELSLAVRERCETQGFLASEQETMFSTGITEWELAPSYAMTEETESMIADSVYDFPALSGVVSTNGNVEINIMPSETVRYYDSLATTVIAHIGIKPVGVKCFKRNGFTLTESRWARVGAETLTPEEKTQGSMTTHKGFPNPYNCRCVGKDCFFPCQYHQTRIREWSKTESGIQTGSDCSLWQRELAATERVFSNLEKQGLFVLKGGSDTILCVSEKERDQFLKMINKITGMTLPVSKLESTLKRVFLTVRKWAKVREELNIRVEKEVSVEVRRNDVVVGESPIGDGVSYMKRSAFLRQFPETEPQAFKVASWFCKGMVGIVADEDWHEFCHDYIHNRVCTEYTPYDYSEYECDWIGDTSSFKLWEEGTQNVSTKWGIHKFASDVCKRGKNSLGSQAVKGPQVFADAYRKIVRQKLEKLDIRTIMCSDADDTGEWKNDALISDLLVDNGFPVGYSPILQKFGMKVKKEVERATECNLRALRAYVLPSDQFFNSPVMFLPDEIEAYIPGEKKGVRGFSVRSPYTSQLFLQAVKNTDLSKLPYFDKSCIIAPSWMLKLQGGDFDGDTNTFFADKELKKVGLPTDGMTFEVPKILQCQKGKGDGSISMALMTSSIITTAPIEKVATFSRNKNSLMSEVMNSSDKERHEFLEKMEWLTNKVLKAGKGPAGLTMEPVREAMKLKAGDSSQLQKLFAQSFYKKSYCCAMTMSGQENPTPNDLEIDFALKQGLVLGTWANPFSQQVEFTVSPFINALYALGEDLEITVDSEFLNIKGEPSVRKLAIDMYEFTKTALQQAEQFKKNCVPLMLKVKQLRPQWYAAVKQVGKTIQKEMKKKNGISNTLEYVLNTKTAQANAINALMGKTVIEVVDFNFTFNLEGNSDITKFATLIYYLQITCLADNKQSWALSMLFAFDPKICQAVITELAKTTGVIPHQPGNKTG